MEAVIAFALAFIFSFLGSIPPGTLNLSILQLGLEHKMQAAWRFAFAAALIEYPYAWVAIEFESIITQTVSVTRYFELITGIVMIVIGIFNLRSGLRASEKIQRPATSGFRRGILLSILNPLALPYWLALTAYMKSMNWITLSDSVEKHSYLFGVSAGAFWLLILIAFLARKVLAYFASHQFIKVIPGAALIALGCYALIRYSMT